MKVSIKDFFIRCAFIKEILNENFIFWVVSKNFGSSKIKIMNTYIVTSKLALYFLLNHIKESSFSFQLNFSFFLATIFEYEKLLLYGYNFIYLRLYFSCVKSCKNFWFPFWAYRWNNKLYRRGYADFGSFQFRYFCRDFLVIAKVRK